MSIVQSLFSDKVLVFVFVINFFVNWLNATTGAMRIAAVKTRRVATALSLYNFFQMTVRLMALFYVPLMGFVVDRAVHAGDIGMLLWQIRFVLLASTLGSILGALSIPTFVRIYMRGIEAVERRHGNLFKLLIDMFAPRRLGLLVKSYTPPNLEKAKGSTLQGIPGNFLVANVFMTAIWGIGVLAALFASAIVPEYARTATLLSGIINGLATILFSLLVDPSAAVIVDQTVHGIRPESQVKSMVVYMTGGTILGTLLGQVFLYHAALIIAWVTTLVGHLH